MTQQPPGWYNQPDGTRRYWDGSRWTEHTAPTPNQPQPPAAPQPGQAAPPQPPGITPPGQTAPAKKPIWQKKRVIIPAAVVVALFGIGSLSNQDKDGTSAQPASPPATSTPPVDSSPEPTSEPSPTEAQETPQAPESEEPEGEAEETPAASGRDNSSAKKATLSAGKHSVPKKLKPGRYVITPGKGQSGNLFVYDSDDTNVVNEILGGRYGVPSVTVDVLDGYKVELRGVKATFTPAKTKLSKKVGAGQWWVGIDIPAGDYVATPKKGQSGNFIVYDESGWPDVNEILGGKYGVAEVSVQLQDGQLVIIRGISKVTFSTE